MHLKNHNSARNVEEQARDSLPGALAVLAEREAVAELRVGELVEAARGVDAEVAPHILAAAEVELLHRARARLEALNTAAATTISYNLVTAQAMMYPPNAQHRS